MTVQILLYRIEEENLATVLLEANKLVQGNLCRMQSFYVEKTEQFHEDVTHHSRYVDGIRNKGISGEDAVMELIHTGPVTKIEIEEGIKEHSFAPTGAAGFISRLMREGKIIRRMDGTYVENEDYKGEEQ